jgi:hypothetical protein
VSRGERVLGFVGAMCAVVWVALKMPGVAGTVIGTVVAGSILALAWRWWREAQEVLLLQAFRDRSGGDLKSPVSLKGAMEDAKLQDPRPVVDRLLYKWQIGPWPKRWIADIPPDEWEREKHRLTDEDQFVPDLFYLNYEGRVRAENERWWWPRGFWM